MNLVGKNAVVYGAGVSGLAAAELLTAKGAHTVIYDDDAANRSAVNNVGVFAAADIIVLSPGVDSAKDFLLDAKLEGKPVISELLLASEICPAEQIAVTGTNGKTTTTMLINEILRRAGRRSHAVGNIGKPLSWLADRLDATEIAVIEASSFQLESSPGFSPDVSVILNIEPDHLERHGSMQKYIDAKSNVIRFQAEQDVVIYNADDANIASILPLTRAHKTPFSLTHPVSGGAYISSGFVCWDGRPVIAVEDADMRGAELENLLAAVAVAKHYDVSDYDICSAVYRFERPLYRRQTVGYKDGVRVVNDSKATNISATLSACRAEGAPSVLILGGAKRAENFDKLFDELPGNVLAVAVCGENAKEIADSALRSGFALCASDAIDRSSRLAVYDDLASSLAGAIAGARTLGCCDVLFSPASKSFDRFEDYKHRGRTFDRIAKEMGVK